MLDDITASPDNDLIATEDTESETVLSDGYIIDCISGEKRVKDTPKEQVRQFIAKALEKEPSGQKQRRR